MIELITNVETSIVSKQFKSFRLSLYEFMCAVVPLSILNALLGYSQDEFSLALQKQITEQMQAKFIRKNCFYHYLTRSRRKSDANTNEDADQVLTHDIEEFSKIISNLFATVVKPSVDIVIYSKKLQQEMGVSTPLVMILYFIVSGSFLSEFREMTGLFATGEQELEGAHRADLKRLMTYAEEVASLNGSEKELKTIKTSLDKLLSYCRCKYQYKAAVAVLDGVFAKYSATIMGWILLSRQFFVSTDDSNSNGENFQTRNKKYFSLLRMVMNLSSAASTLVLAGQHFLFCYSHSPSPSLPFSLTLITHAFARSQVNSLSLSLSH